MWSEALTEKFHPSLVKKNQANQDYVAIDGYINRLNDVLGSNWSWSVNTWEFRDAPPTAKGKPQYMAVVSGTLSIKIGDEDMFSYVSRDGIGAGFNFDPDTAVKTAQAEALKKACHQFGIALYLWDAAERDYVELQRRAGNDDVALKRLAVAYTNRVLELGPDTTPTKDQMLEVLGVADLEVATIRNILSKKEII